MVKVGCIMIIKFNQSLYSKAALFKTAFHFTSDYYIHLDIEDEYYIVDIKGKEGTDSPHIDDEFKNQLIAQVTREEILKQTKDIRSMILGRALASTIIDEGEDQTEESIEDEDMFKDWHDEIK